MRFNTSTIVALASVLAFSSACAEGIQTIPPPARGAEVAPVLTNFTLSPAVAGGDTLITVSFVSDQLPGPDPTVSIAGESAALDHVVNNATYVFTHTMEGTPTEGLAQVVVRFENAYGNAAELSADILLDFTAPAAGPVAPEQGTDTLVPGSFSLVASFDVDVGADAAVSDIISCEYCKTTDGACDIEWVPALSFGSTCLAPGLTCANGDQLLLTMRATDAAGNTGEAQSITRGCDTQRPTPGALATSNPESPAYVAESFAVSAPFVDDSTIPQCQVCAATDGTCDDGVGDSDWLAGSMVDGRCTSAALSCSHGDVLTLGLRAHDDLRDDWAQTSTSVRICDGIAPVQGTLTTGGAGGFVPNGFSLSTTFSDGGASGVFSCEQCVSRDGACDDEWEAALWENGRCQSLVGNSCIGSEALTVALRATDAVGNISVASPAAVVCDTDGPVGGVLSINGIAEPTEIPSLFEASLSFNDDGVGMAACEFCVTDAGMSCDAGWFGGVLQGDTCVVPDALCNNGLFVGLHARGIDQAGTVGEVVTLDGVLCDGESPVAGDITLDSDTTNAAYVSGGGFGLSTSFSDTGGIDHCEVCVRNDGACDSEWQPATLVAGVCSASGLTCTNGQVITLTMRATDTAGNVTGSGVLIRTCDGQGPSSLALGVDGVDSATHVPGSGFSLSATLSDPLAGTSACDYCVSNDGDCAGDWQAGSLNITTGVCSVAVAGCTGGETLTLDVRGIDGVGNTTSVSSAISRICSDLVPTASAPVSSESVDVGGQFYVPRNFSLASDFSYAAPAYAPAGLVSCEICDDPSGTCDAASDWQSATFDGATGECSMDLSCQDASALGYRFRVQDGVGQWHQGPLFTAICDDSAPSPGPILTTGGATTSHVRGTGFDVRTVFSEIQGGSTIMSGVSGCEVCVSTDGFCDDEWQAATVSAGTSEGFFSCEATGLSCTTEGQDVVIGMRATDALGATDTAVAIGRVCDVEAPLSPMLSADRPNHYALELQWTEAAEVGSGLLAYDISYQAEGAGAAESSSTFFTEFVLGDEGGTLLDGCTDYTVQITATDRVGNSSQSNALTMKTRCGNDGGFYYSHSVTLGASADEAAIADFNGDGVLDFVTIMPSEGQVYLGNGSAGRGDGTFSLSDTLSYTGSARGLGVSDFNHDDIADIAVYYGDVDNFYIRTFNGNGGLGKGDGTFSLGADISGFSGNARDLHLLDLNNDNIVDFIGSSQRVGSVRRSMGQGSNGRGDGSFGAASDTDGSRSHVFASGDFDHDGNVDVAAVQSSYGGLRVLLGQGDGALTLNQTVTVPLASQGLVARDLNGDNILDIVGVGATSLSVLLGDGADGVGGGSFSLLSGFALGYAPTAFSVFDADNDGIEDIIVGGSGHLEMWKGIGSGGQGTGYFELFQTVSVSGGIPWLGRGDFNGDGLQDLLVVSGNASIDFFYGTGAVRQSDGLFSYSHSVATGSGPRAAVVGDFDGDGFGDLVSVDYASDTLTMLAGTGTLGQNDGGYGAVSAAVVDDQPTDLVQADFDRDGVVDLVSVNWFDENMGIAMGSGANGLGDGRFLQNIRLTGFGTWARPIRADAGDFNGDGFVDIVSVHPGYAAVSRSSAWACITVSTATAGEWTGFAASDCAYDTRPDPGTDALSTYRPNDVTVADLSDDGILDFAITVPGASASDGATDVLVFLGDGSSGVGDGTFTLSQRITLADRPMRIAHGDFNHDGIMDLVTTLANNTVVILVGNIDPTSTASGGQGDGTFTEGNTYAVGTAPQDILAYDLNGDSVPDIATANSGGTISLLFGAGDATFAAATNVSIGGSLTGLVVLDYDSNGTLDLAATSSSTSDVRFVSSVGTYSQSVE